MESNDLATSWVEALERPAQASPFVASQQVIVGTGRRIRQVLVERCPRTAPAHGVDRPRKRHPAYERAHAMGEPELRPGRVPQHRDQCVLDHVFEFLALQSEATEQQDLPCPALDLAARTELAPEKGPGLFEPHPPAEDLARLATGDPDLDPATRGRLTAHAQACPTCAREVDLAREADRTAWARAPQAWIRQGAHGVGLLRPALAVLAALLVFPAYLGLVRYPEQRAESHRLEAELDRAQRPVTPPPGPPWGGAAPLLFLSGPERSGSSTPTVTLRPGQPYLAVLVAYDPREGTSDSIEVRIVRASDRATVWRSRARSDELWDPALEALTVLVPAEGWLPGAYRLELAWGRRADPRFVAPFQVRRAPGS